MNDEQFERPSYYSIIPATVRYDKRLKAYERLMFSEITALSNKYGYCTASNSYFASLYEVDKTTISRWLSHLSDLKYVRIKNEWYPLLGNVRKIYPNIDVMMPNDCYLSDEEVRAIDLVLACFKES